MGIGDNFIYVYEDAKDEKRKDKDTKKFMTQALIQQL